MVLRDDEAVAITERVGEEAVWAASEAFDVLQNNGCSSFVSTSTSVEANGAASTSIAGERVAVSSSTDTANSQEAKSNQPDATDEDSQAESSNETGDQTLSRSAVDAAVAEDRNPGFSIIWGGDGPSKKQQLNYVLEYEKPKDLNDRYRLRVGQQSSAIDRINVVIPESYSGSIRLAETTFQRLDGEVFEVASVEPTIFGTGLTFILKDPIPVKTKFEAVFSGLKLPSDRGMSYVNASVYSPGETPLRRYVSTWVID